MADSVRHQVRGRTSAKAERAQDAKSISSASSDPPMPKLGDVLSGPESERAPPTPTHPIYETVTCEGPPPPPSVPDSSGQYAKLQSTNSTKRVPYSRGSMVDATATKPVRHVPTLAAQHPRIRPAFDAGPSFPTVRSAPLFPRRRLPTMCAVTSLLAWNYQM